ncbi:MAG: glycosyltransferase family 39 protein [Clostridia bacterium]|nr:glycosyltransferase family 39 protein [Clostridia bacterium]
MKKTRNIHIAIIILGILFNCISIFHPNLWFDEAYSVGIANKSFIDIWKIGGNDVHPVLYYWILHIIYLVTHNLFGMSTNGTIIAYRVFSATCISLLGILGFTHIRKDFGEKTGALFSFFSYFLPVICIYAAEVRMYSLAVLLVTILAIYAYRLFKDDSKIKNWIIFGVTSLGCIYAHYYGLMAAGIINCVMLFYFIKQKKTASIIKIMTSGVIQLLAYIPWIMYFMKQLSNVSKGFWIGFEFPKTVFQLLGVQFSGNIEKTNDIIGFILVLLMFGYIIFRLIRNKKSSNEKVDVAAKASIAIYFSVILAAIIMTAFLKTSILYYRYLFVITGLFIFFISYGVSKEKNKYIVGVICAVTLGFAIWSNYLQITEAYDKNNMTPIAYLQDNVQPGDVLVFDESNFGTGSVISLYFTDNKQIFYNPGNWGVDAAYRAFGDQLKIYTNTDFVNECTGRVWVIDSENMDYYNKAFNNGDFNIISKKSIKVGYENYSYNMILVERVNK